MLGVDFKVIKRGDRVLLTNPNPKYTLGPSNPARGTEWECEGTYAGGPRVDWDNGRSNGYSNFELSRKCDYISIW